MPMPVRAAADEQVVALSEGDQLLATDWHDPWPVHLESAEAELDQGFEVVIDIDLVGVCKDRHSAGGVDGGESLFGADHVCAGNLLRLQETTKRSLPVPDDAALGEHRGHVVPSHVGVVPSIAGDFVPREVEQLDLAQVFEDRPNLSVLGFPIAPRHAFKESVAGVDSVAEHMHRAVGPAADPAGELDPRNHRQLRRRTNERFEARGRVVIGERSGPDVCSD